MPVSTSPVPPLARPGLPVGLMKTSPDGIAMTDAAPLRTTLTFRLTARLRATSRRVALHVGHRGAEQAGHLAGMRREAARTSGVLEQVEVAGERGERVGVEHHGPGQRARDLTNQGLGFGVETQARADGDRVAACCEFGMSVSSAFEAHRTRGWSRAAPLGHRLEHQACHHGLLARGRGRGDQPRAAAHRRPGGQGRGAGLAQRAGHDEEVPVACPCARCGDAAAGGRATSPRLQQERSGHAADLTSAAGSRCPRRGRSGVVEARWHHQSALEPGEGRRERGAHDRPGRRSTVGGAGPRECRARRRAARRC